MSLKSVKPFVMMKKEKVDYLILLKIFWGKKDLTLLSGEMFGCRSAKKGQVSSSGGKRKKPTVETSSPMSIDPAQVEKVYLEKLAKKVMDKYGYFFTKEQLISDPEFLKAVAKAMDEDSTKFYYNGRRYALPSIVETDSHQTAVELILENRGQIACSSWIGSSACVDLPEFDWLNDNPGRRKAYEDVYDKEKSREMAVNYTEVGKQKLKVVRDNSPSCAQGTNGVNDPSLRKNACPSDYSK